PLGFTESPPRTLDEFQFTLCFLRELLFNQQSTRFAASPPSLVSLYFAPMSRPVSARVLIVVSRSTRWRDAISLVAIMNAIHAFTAPNAQRSMQGTWTYPATWSHVMPR